MNTLELTEKEYLDFHQSHFIETIISKMKLVETEMGEVEVDICAAMDCKNHTYANKCRLTLAALATAWTGLVTLHKTATQKRSGILKGIIIE